MKNSHIVLILVFILLYSTFIAFVDIQMESAIISQLIAASVFFFALFAGFFISRQSERYARITEILSERDGAFSFIYRASGLIPRMQTQVRDIIRRHYEKIFKKNDWAYHEFHTSTTITELTDALGSITNEEGTQPKITLCYKTIWDAIFQLQRSRKKIIAAYQQKMLLFQWALIYIFAFLLVISLGFLRTDYLFIDILKIVFSTSVFLVIILIKQLNDLSIFGKNFSKNIAKDVLHIIDETDAKETRQG